MANTTPSSVSQHDSASATVFMAPGLYSTLKLDPSSFADPAVLWDRHQALVEEEFEAIVVRSHQEASAPEVWAPMADGVDEADELLFVGSEGTVPWRDGPAEVGDPVLLQTCHCTTENPTSRTAAAGRCGAPRKRT